MRDHILAIIDYARNAMGNNNERTEQLLSEIETEAMAALHGGATIIPSKMFGEITIPQNVITKMSNGEDDLWLNHGCALDVNIFYVPDGWHWGIYPINHEGTDTDNLIEKGKL
jgi:hypothetical protein